MDGQTSATGGQTTSPPRRITYLTRARAGDCVRARARVRVCVCASLHATRAHRARLALSLSIAHNYRFRRRIHLSRLCLINTCRATGTRGGDGARACMHVCVHVCVPAARVRARMRLACAWRAQVPVNGRSPTRPAGKSVCYLKSSPIDTRRLATAGELCR